MKRLALRRKEKNTCWQTWKHTSSQTFNHSQHLLYIMNYISFSYLWVQKAVTIFLQHVSYLSDLCHSETQISCMKNMFNCYITLLLSPLLLDLALYTYETVFSHQMEEMNHSSQQGRVVALASAHLSKCFLILVLITSHSI